VAALEAWVLPIHAEILTTAGERNIGEWCKKDACWESVKALALPMPSPLPPEFRPAGDRESDAPIPGPATSDASGSSLVDACCQLDGTAWAKVMVWAASSSGVTEFDRRVAHTVMGYALQAWSKRPSEKQAVCAIRVIQAARHFGVIPPS